MLISNYTSVSEKIKVTEEMPKYQLQIIEDNKFSISKNKQLISNLDNKRKTNSTIKA